MLIATPILVIRHTADVPLYLHIYSAACLPLSNGLAAHTRIFAVAHSRQEMF
jgi:hypothetical protein